MEGEEDDSSPYENFFEMTVGLCRYFPGLTPLSLRQSKAREVFILFRRFMDYNEKEQNKQDVKSGKKAIRKKAGDDWF